MEHAKTAQGCSACRAEAKKKKKDILKVMAKNHPHKGEQTATAQFEAARQRSMDYAHSMPEGVNS